MITDPGDHFAGMPGGHMEQPSAASLITRDVRHNYTWNGITYPGVTGILKVLDKSDALVGWASKNTALAALALINTRNELGETPADILRNSAGDEAFVRAVTSRANWQRDEAARIGTAIHGMAEHVVRGEPTPSMPPDIADRVLLYAEWWQRSGWRLRVAEGLLVNTTYKYGGTLDLLCYDQDGRTVLADIKTGKNVYAETCLQLAAYGMAEVIQADGRVFKMPQVDRHVIVHVTHEQVREIEVPGGTAEEDAFIAACELARWRESIKNRFPEGYQR